MKFTLSWLKQFLDTNYSALEIANVLTDIGLEVEELTDRSVALQNFEVAYIIATKPHPSADKLKICEVQTKNGLLQIVCGANNARENIKVVLASVGVEIPNGKFKIKESVIRGEKSSGMLCSEEELLLASESEGIIELPDDAIVGMPFIKYYGLDDPIFDISITPNRGDALGVYGIARDLAAKGAGILKEPEIPNLIGNYQTTTKVVTDTKSCPLFAFREIKNLQNKPSPAWLQQLLKNIGITPISAIVDVTNYISYSFGQPMHAYDADKLTGNIVVEFYSHGDKHFQALNDRTYILQLDDLVVRDDQNVQALAGIIGGMASSTTLETNNILLEAACFDAKTVAATGRRLQIETDSRYRFERNIDHAFTEKALSIASNLIVSLCASGEISEMVKMNATVAKQVSLDFPVNYLEQLTGLKLDKDEIYDILCKLGFNPVIKDKVITVAVPTWRHDIAILEDVAEEIVRIYGYDKLEAVELPKIEQGVSQGLKEQKRISTFKRILASKGYDEVVTNSFMNNVDAKLFADLKDELFLLNPISRDNDYMRPNIIPNLLRLVEKNLARSLKDIALFEVGPSFTGIQPSDELTHLSGVRCGAYAHKNPHSAERAYDVFDIKADLEIVLNYAGLSIDKCKLNQDVPDYYHPTRAASFSLGKNLLGYFGQLHPKILKYYNIEANSFAFELNIIKLPSMKPKFGKRDEFIISDFQVNFRDFAFIIDNNMVVGEMISYVSNFNKKLIKSVDVFDIYVGDKLPIGKKSVAIKIELQADDRTLNEQELNLLSKDLIAAIEQKFQGKLRE